LPALTRFIDIELTATRATGENDGYADNIALIVAMTGDLDFNAAINAADWAIFRTGQHADMTGFTRSQALALGDLNGDFRNDFADFALFKSIFETANGTGSFAVMLADVPEPRTIGMAVAALFVFSFGLPRRGKLEVLSGFRKSVRPDAPSATDSTSIRL
jgi:hypothetical protein